MERTAIVFRGTVLVPEACQSRVAIWGPITEVYLLGGRGFFRNLRVRLRAIGSKFFAASADGGGASKEDWGSRFGSTTVDDALRRKHGRAASTMGLASRAKSAAARKGSSRRAMRPSIEGRRDDSRWRRPDVQQRTLSPLLRLTEFGRRFGGAKTFAKGQG